MKLSKNVFLLVFATIFLFLVGCGKKPPISVFFTDDNVMKILNLDKGTPHKITVYVDGEKYFSSTLSAGEKSGKVIVPHGLLSKKGAKIEIYAEGFSSPIKGKSPGYREN